MFDHRFVPSVATHAENEYAQTLGECGLVGVVVAGLFVLPIAAALFRTLWHPAEATQFAAFGIAFGLLAILIHSGSDFGQHAPPTPSSPRRSPPCRSPSGGGRGGRRPSRRSHPPPAAAAS